MKRNAQGILQAFPLVAGATVAAIACAYLAAWMAGAMTLRGETVITMKANAAACLLLLGLSLILLSTPAAGGFRRWAGRILAGVALAVGVLTFAENAAGWNLGIDQLLASEAPGARGVVAPNRMGSPASISIALAGIALLLLSRRRPRALHVVQGLALVVCLLGLLPTLGYLYGVRPLYGLARVTSIAWPTALSLIVLGAGVLLTRPSDGPIAQFTAPDAGGAVLRRLLLPLVLLPIGLGWLDLTFERLGLVEPPMGTALLALAFILSLSAVAWLAGRRGSRADAEQRRAEAALRESEAQYRLLFASNPTPMFVFDDETLQILAVNDTAIRHYGWTRDEFLGMSVLDVRPGEDRDKARDIIARYRGTYDARIGTVRHCRKDGTVMDMDVSVSSIHFAGRPARLVSMNDVTVRRQAEEALRRYELVVRESRDVLLFVRRSDGRILAANPAATETYGYGLDELLSMSISDLRAPETRGRVEADMVDADAKGILFETVHQRKDGSTFPAEVSSRGAHIGDVRVLISVVRDISARKWAELALRRANDRLRETDERKNEFLAVLSHELRNPLAPIHNGLQVLERAGPGSEAARRALEVIARQVRQLSRLVDDLLDVVRVSRNKIRLRLTSFDLNDLVRRTVHDHCSLFDERGITVETDLSEQPLPVNGDEARLSQVLGNLLHNAAKFTPSGGRVVVRTTVPTAGGRVALHVADNGIGLEAETLQRLFEPFMQADMALDRSKGGLGLGLALVKGLVEMHGGQVTARSEGVGRGAEFVVELPLAAEAPPAVASDDSEPGLRARRVLVIEDNLDAGETLKTMLELEGHVVRLAHDGPDGLSAAKEFRPDVVLCDIGLPGMDGFEVARAFRADPEMHGIGLVALSGYALHDDVQRARQAGFDRHLAKPATPEAVQRVLMEVPLVASPRDATAGLH